QAAALVAAMGAAPAIVMRGNGAVCVGPSLEDAACLAFFLEDAAALELALAGAHGRATPYTDDEVAERAVRTGGLFERMWDYLTFGDPERTA
ncbi:MAG TPA: class II aldolase/adducin family protein, partial [Azospirillum sp.]